MFPLQACSLDVTCLTSLRFGFVTARFHSDIVLRISDASREVLAEVGVSDKYIRVIAVPGSLELPLATRWLMAHCDAVMAFGCVIKGGTLHYDLVAYHAIREMLAISAEGALVSNAIMMSVDKEEALQRAHDYGRSAMLDFLALLSQLERGNDHVR